MEAMEMKFRNCKRCGKAFTSALSYTVCPSCMQEEERTYNRIKEYLVTHPMSSAEELCKNCDITEEEFFKLLHKEKIMLPNISPISYPCSSCGEPIKRGNFCYKCKMQLNRRTFR